MRKKGGARDKEKISLHLISPHFLPLICIILIFAHRAWFWGKKDDRSRYAFFATSGVTLTFHKRAHGFSHPNYSSTEPLTNGKLHKEKGNSVQEQHQGIWNKERSCKRNRLQSWKEYMENWRSSLPPNQSLEKYGAFWPLRGFTFDFGRTSWVWLIGNI